MEREKQWTSVKCPVLHFYGTKTYLFFFFCLFPTSVIVSFFSGVLVNGHLYVNMKNQDQVLIDGLLENHVGLVFVWERRSWEILPWLSFDLLISRLSTSLCMVSGRCCISLKTKSWREDSYCVKKIQQLFIGLTSYEWIFSRGNSNSIHPLTLWSWLPWRGPVCRLIKHGSLSSAQSVQRRRNMRHNLGPLASVVGLTLDYHEEH